MQQRHQAAHEGSTFGIAVNAVHHGGVELDKVQAQFGQPGDAAQLLACMGQTKAHAQRPQRTRYLLQQFELRNSAGLRHLQSELPRCCERWPRTASIRW